MEEENINIAPTTEEVVEEKKEINQDNKEIGEAKESSSLQPPDQNKKTGAELNFERLRESKERAERERDELLKKLQEKHEKKQDYKIDINEDDLVEGRHIKKLQAELEAVQARLENQQKQAYNMTAETKLRSKYPDFDSVVSPENVKMLRDAYPEIAATLASSPDLYAQGLSAYTMIKKLGIIQPSYDRDKEIAIKNSMKPKPLTSVEPQNAESPLSHANAFANGLTEDLKKQLLREMNEAAKKA